MEVKEGFKQSTLGMIPDRWDINCLSDICDVRDGTHDSPKYYKQGVPLVTSKNIVDGNLSLDDINLISIEDANIINKRSKVDKGDILVSMIGTIGNAILVSSEPDYCIKNIALIKPENVFNKFLYQLIISPVYQAYLLSKLDGGIQKFISLGVLRSLEVPLPPPPEQQAIAEVLSDTDNLIYALEKQIAKKRLIKRGVMQELLTPKEGWEKKKLGDIGPVKMCKRIFSHQTKSQGTIPFYKIGTFGKEADAFISEELYQNYRRQFSFPKAGDILISAAGTIGRTVVYDGRPAYFQDSNIVWIDNNETIVSNRLLYYILQIVKYNTEGGTIQRLYNSILRNAEFYCPLKPEQIYIATILSDMDTKIQALEIKMIKLQSIKQSLIQNLLTGKIRLLKS